MHNEIVKYLLIYLFIILLSGLLSIDWPDGGIDPTGVPTSALH